MIRGLYTGASGMSAQQVRLDAISNNLANVDTDGYKRDVAVHKAFAELLLRRTNDDGVTLNPFGSGDMAPVIGKIGTGVENNEIFTEFEQGALKQTENDFDLAMDGKGFFAIQTPYGGALHPLGRLRARQGRLSRDQGRLPRPRRKRPHRGKGEQLQSGQGRQRLRKQELPGRPLPPRLPRGEYLGGPQEARHPEDRRFPERPLHRQAGRRASGAPPTCPATRRSSRRARGPR